MIEALPADRWQAIPWREHADGVLRTQCVAVRLHWATGGPQVSTRQPRVCTGPAGGRLGERPGPGERGALPWSLRNRPADTPLRRLVEWAPSRWPIEQCYADAQGECGWDHDQGRRWDGRQRPRALVRLASRFLARQGWAPATPAGFAPRRGAPSVPGGPSPRARVALPGGRGMAHGHEPDRPVSPQADLTK